MSTAVDKLDTKWTQWFPPPIVAEYDQCSLVVILALHRQVTVTKKVFKEPFSIIQRKRHPNGRLRRGGSQVSGSSQFAQRFASSTLGRLEHNLRVALSKAPCRSNGGDQFRRSLVIDGFCNRTTIPLIQFAKIEEFCRKAIWPSVTFRYHSLNVFNAVSDNLPRPSRSPRRGLSAKSIIRLYSPQSVSPRGSPREKDQSPLAFNPSCKGYNMRHHPAETTVAIWERVGVVQPVMGGCNRDDPSARGPRRNLKPFVKVIHECRDARR